MSAATGEENSSSFSPASAMLSVWAMCGGSRTCVTRTAEVSGRPGQCMEVSVPVLQERRGECSGLVQS